MGASAGSDRGPNPWKSHNANVSNRTRHHALKAAIIGVRMGQRDFVDRVGRELPNRGAAMSEARARALEALKDGFAQGEDRRDWIIVIRDDLGAPVMRLTLGEAAGSDVSKILA